MRNTLGLGEGSSGFKFSPDGPGTGSSKIGVHLELIIRLSLGEPISNVRTSPTFGGWNGELTASNPGKISCSGVSLGVSFVKIVFS